MVTNMKCKNNSISILKIKTVLTVYFLVESNLFLEFVAQILQSW